MYNNFPDEVALLGINADKISITKKNMADTEEYIKRIENQSHPDMKVPTLTGTNVQGFDPTFTAAVRRQNCLIVILLNCLPRTDAFGSYNTDWNTREES